MTNTNDFDGLIRWVRVARGLEAGGFYNAAKLLWAAAFSAEISGSSAQGVPIAPDALDREMTAAIKEIEAHGAKSDFIAALKLGQVGARENRTIPASEIPQVNVCRTCGEIMLGEPPRRCPACGAYALTFREFLPIYFLEPLEPSTALAALAEGPEQVGKAVQGLTEEQMRRAPHPGEWTVRDVLTHILVANGLLSARVEIMLNQDNPSLKGVAAWNIGDQESLSAQGIIERYRTSRQSAVARLKGMAPQDWWRAAQHEEFVRFTILQEASYFSKHEREHLPQIAAIRKALGA